ncbi:Argininosuccinate lyase (plasmid) [Variovorax sp. SRS16]|uniref:Bug family tripartite tricarboxylate transporter substrate binding protein n=1 Tax=Variovorax sp. SRS16 TaxID=282217 RepID=UPI0013187559|nr:tripartite tricarboxylate transporter substrate-binding protein [Variovorax sp. SRS16]VTU46319.1 Argininosuccinate lyase [Variovorax sp. SRS16]
MHSPFLSPRGRERRALLARLGAVGAASALPLQAAWASDGYPTHPIRVVVPFGPGGLADISMRLIAQKLSERLGQQFVIDNRPGAGGVAAATGTLSAPRDGHTLIMFTNGTAIGKSLFKLSYDPETDFTPISSLTYFDLILITRKDGSIGDLKALLAQGRQRQLTLGTINPGSTQNLSGELFRSVSRIKAELVPYKSTPEVLTALIRGDIDVAFESYAALKGPVDSGQVKVIATTGPTRTAWLPQVPTVREAGLPGYEVTGWNALYAAVGVPPKAVEVLDQAVREVIHLPDVRERLLKLGTEPKASTPAELAAVFRRDAAKWAEVIRVAGIKVQ